MLAVGVRTTYYVLTPIGGRLGTLQTRPEYSPAPHRSQQAPPPLSPGSLPIAATQGLSPDISRPKGTVPAHCERMA